MHQTWLQPTEDKSVLATFTARPKLQISVHDLKLTTVIDQNTCRAKFHKISGCANCPEGATASFTCSTDFGESEGHVFCGETISFPLKCTRAGYFQEVNIYLNKLAVDLKCNLTCPSNKQQLDIHRSLVKSIAENQWSHRYVADAQPTSSFIFPALEALTDFWKTSWYYMIGTLIIAGIIALIILKHI
uniref:Uncharacterized protein n=1 Tax=Panagrolaimus superbus TaxID=310955 RepID=A0A914Z7X5_9BILA